MSKGISLFPEPTCTSLVISRPFRGAKGLDCYCKHPCSSVKARAKLPFGLRLSFSSQLGWSKEAVRLTGDLQQGNRALGIAFVYNIYDFCASKVLKPL